MVLERQILTDKCNASLAENDQRKTTIHSIAKINVINKITDDQKWPIKD